MQQFSETDSERTHSPRGAGSPGATSRSAADESCAGANLGGAFAARRRQGLLYGKSFPHKIPTAQPISGCASAPERGRRTFALDSGKAVHFTAQV